MTEDDKALVEQLRDDLPQKIIEKHWVDDNDAINKQREESADRIEALSAENGRLREVLTQIEAGTYPRPLGKSWRMDLSSSKHDLCIHDRWMYETCDECLDAFVRAALGETKMTEITQADRDAAAQYDVVEAFARHRKYGYDQGYYDGRQLDGKEERAAIVAMIWGDVRSDYISEYHADILRDLIDRIEGGEHLK